MTLDERAFVRQATAWVATTEIGAIDTGLPREEALSRAQELMNVPPGEGVKLVDEKLDDAAIDVLYGACQILAEQVREKPVQALGHARSLFECISVAKWHESDFGERAELLCDLTFAAWRAARRAGSFSTAREWLQRFSSARRSLDALVPDRVSRATDLEMQKPENLLAFCARLHEQILSTPQRVLEEAESLYSSLGKSLLPTGLLDERDYFLGEAALLSGMASRLLARREDARRWFDRAEASHRLTVDAVAALLRVSYQRLALDLEERELDRVLRLAPLFSDNFRKLNMVEDSLKCRSLEGLAFMEMGELKSALAVFKEVCRAALPTGAEQVLASAYVNLVHLHAMLGDAPDALAASREAIPILRKAGNRVDLAKVEWGMATLMQTTGQGVPAVEVYRSAQRHFAAMGMMADVAAGHLVLAELLLELSREQEALWEILKALPIIDELKMVPEGMAAFSLLRESVRQQRINRQALRDLHGYFEETRK